MIPDGQHCRFCHSCGHDGLEYDAAESRFTCRRCGQRSYLNSKPSVCAVIVADGRVLLLPFGDPSRGTWDVPGGFLLYGEPPEEGLRRELREELGVEVEVGELLAALVDTYGDGPEYSLNLFYETRLGATPPDRGQKWFALDELPSLEFDSTRTVLAKYPHTAKL